VCGFVVLIPFLGVIHHDDKLRTSLHGYGQREQEVKDEDEVGASFEATTMDKGQEEYNFTVLVQEEALECAEIYRITSGNTASLHN